MIRSILLASAFAVAAFTATSASAAICPINANCDLQFTFNADGSVTTTGAGGSSIGGEDAIIGVNNNTNHIITSFVLDGHGVNIYGFESDGIDTYSGIGPAGSNPDTTTYGGPNGFFTNISGSIGTVNFANGGIAPGGMDYFSLEEAVSLANPPTIGAPEPAAIALLGFGLCGGVIARRRFARG